MSEVRNTALLVIDMQRDFCDPGGYAAHTGIDVGNLRRPIAAIVQLVAEARHCGIQVIYTREGHRPDRSDCLPEKLARSRRAGAEIGSPGPLGRLLIRGEYGHDLIDELVSEPGELLLDKAGYGAFYQTDLELLLKKRGIERLVFTGVTTDICVHSSLREAVDRGYVCTTVADACGAADPRLHDAALQMIGGEGNILGAVCSAADVMVRWRAAAGA